MNSPACAVEPTLWTDPPQTHTAAAQRERLVAIARCYGCPIRLTVCARMAAEWHPPGQIMAGRWNSTSPEMAYRPRATGTHCAHGHEWTPDTIGTDAQGYRYCRACGRARGAEHYRRRKAG